MRVPVSWLRDLIDIEPPVDAIAERLNLAGVEVEDVEGIGVFDPNVVVGEVLETTPAAAAPQANLTLVSIGGGGVQAVSAAADLRDLLPGTKVAVATSGAKLLDRSSQVL